MMRVMNALRRELTDAIRANDEAATERVFSQLTWLIRRLVALGGDAVGQLSISKGQPHSAVLGTLDQGIRERWDHIARAHGFE
jgi:hypothetical protein